MPQDKTMIGMGRMHGKAMLVLIAGILVIIGLVWYFGVRTLFMSISLKQTEIQQSAVARDNAKEKIERLPEFRSQYDLIMREESKVFSLLPESRIVDFVKEVELLAEETGNAVEINEDQKSADTDKAKRTVSKEGEGAGEADASAKTNEPKSIRDNLPHTKDLRVKIKLKGEYGGVLQFLHKLESLNYALDVIALEISREDESLEEVRANASGNFLAIGTAETGASVLEEPRKTNIVEAVLETAVYLE